MIRGGARKGRAGRRTSASVGPSHQEGDPVRVHVHRAADVAIEARFACERDDDERLLDAVKRARQAFLDAEIALFARMRRGNIRAARGRG